MLLITQIDAFYNGLTLSHRGTINTAAGGTFMQKTLKECYEFIENMTAHHNHWDTSAILDETSKYISSTSTTESPEVVRKLKMMNKNFLEMMRQIQTIKIVDTKCETYGGPHSFTECPATGGYTQETAYATTGNNNSGGIPTNCKMAGDLKAITTRSGVSYDGSPIPPPPTSSLPKMVERVLEVTKDTVQLKLDECLALADLGASINLMPLSIWRKLSLPKLTPTRMILELADRSTTRPAGIAKDVFVKVGKFYFLTDFVVVDYIVDPRVPLFLEKPFRRALIDVYGEELTLRIDDKVITFKVGQTSKYSYNDAESINRIDVIDVACEEYVQEVLGFFDNSKSGNPILIFDLIIPLSSPSLTPFKGGDCLLEEIEACLTSKSMLSGIDDTDFDLEGDIHLLEELLNNDPSSSPLPPKELNVE
nr:reverse transcriptase domain-containing protein [Tanacetum cinerariifolium]